MSERAFTIHDVDQRSEEWKNLRLGRVTGSSAHEMVAKLKDKKTPAASRKNLLTRIVLERLTNRSQERSDFQSSAMKDGIDREPDAIGAYEVASGCLVQTTGFLAHNTLMIGASLDGHLDDFDVLVSVKCRQEPQHWEFLRSGTVPTDAWVQMQHELLLTDALEHHYVSFNPSFPEHMRLHWKVYKREDFDLSGYEKELRLFLEDVDRELSVMQGWKAAS